jgi:hypothetical protein
MCTHRQSITIAMTDFGGFFLTRFPLQRGVLGDGIQAADYELLLGGRVPNISCSGPDSLAGVSTYLLRKEDKGDFNIKIRGRFICDYPSCYGIRKTFNHAISERNGFPKYILYIVAESIVASMPSSVLA